MATKAGKSEEEKKGTKVEPRSRANKQKERNISVRVDLDAIPKGEGDSSFIVGVLGSCRSKKSGQKD